MPSRQRSHTSVSTKSIQRPDSRASTTSAISQNDDAHAHHEQAIPATYMNNHGPEAALLQYHAGIAPNHGQMYDMPQHQYQQQFSHPHAHSAQFPIQAPYHGQDASYIQPDPGYSNHARVGSVPVQSGTEGPDDKRKKGSAVTATNDKELREMLSKNEGRELREVAHEVIQKERTPMAEKTKQLFAMLW